MFRFKQFSVLNSGSAFKVGTDAVLLGSAATVLGTERRILDAGTGTGIIALMIAQRLAATGLADFEICGIDINAEGIEETTKNFASSLISIQNKDLFRYSSFSNTKEMFEGLIYIVFVA